MTIAVCYPCLEGMVLGADSTTTIGNLHYNYCQKVYEFGEKGSTIGMVIWGLGSFPDTSYRTLMAEVAEKARQTNLPTFGDVACLWSETVWAEYTRIFEQSLIRTRALERKGVACTEDEKKEFIGLKRDLSCGFCLAGRWGANRRPEAFDISFNPLLAGAPAPKSLPIGQPVFWGCGNLINRVNLGIDLDLFEYILKSGKWAGTRQDLAVLVRDGVLIPPANLPIREAIDFVYAEIYTTIKAMKFSQLAPVCGGPIEIAVITTDRPFRWVCHKDLSKAIMDVERIKYDFQANA